MLLTRGLPRHHIWLGIIFANRQGRQFNGCSACVIVYQLLCNLLLLNTVPTEFAGELFHHDLYSYSLPFNLLAFVIAAIIEVSNITMVFICLRVYFSVSICIDVCLSIHLYTSNNSINWLTIQSIQGVFIDYRSQHQTKHGLCLSIPPFLGPWVCCP